MSSQERIQNNISVLEQELEEINQEIRKIQKELKSEHLSEDEKTKLDVELQDLMLDKQDVQSDINMLQELLDKMNLEEEYDTGNCGLDWNESGYFD